MGFGWSTGRTKSQWLRSISVPVLSLLELEDWQYVAIDDFLRTAGFAAVAEVASRLANILASTALLRLTASQATGMMWLVSVFESPGPVVYPHESACGIWN